MNKALHQKANSNPNKSDAWYTPRLYPEAAMDVFGGPISLDPASSEEANQTIGALLFHTRETNGLDKEWFGNIWLNAPSAEKGVHEGQCEWQAKLIAEYEAGRVRQAVMLVYRVAPDTKWFQQLFNYPLCFVKGRIKFEAPAGTYAKQGSQPMHASAFAYFGPNEERFAGVFSQFGTVIMGKQKVSK